MSTVRTINVFLFVSFLEYSVDLLYISSRLVALQKHEGDFVANSDILISFCSSEVMWGIVDMHSAGYTSKKHLPFTVVSHLK